MTENVKVIYNHVAKVKEAVSGDDLMRAIKAGGFVLEGWAKINANSVFSSKATNTLAGSITVLEDEKSETHASVDVGPTVIYGRIQELGGFIKPVFAKALHFVIDGVHVVTQLVQIPARPYLRPAYDEHEKDILNTIGNHIKGEIERVTE